MRALLGPGGMEDMWGGSKDLIFSVGTQEQKAVLIEREGKAERRQWPTAREKADSSSTQRRTRIYINLALVLYFHGEVRKRGGTGGTSRGGR